DDFAYATRDGLVGEIRFTEDAAAAAARGAVDRFAEIDFDFQLQKAPSPEQEAIRDRVRAEA
ncbi:catechol 1,2-dioxygenase, partial [Pseudomonas sp. JG-B]|nr:catechol 1,2-dioxygenase [Pseudomonas sp. JG-B]